VNPPRAHRDREPVHVVRIIARLNIGGPAIQAITLTHRLDERGYATTLVRGREEPDEGNMDHLADELGVHPVLVPSLRRNPGAHDLQALAALIRILRRERPQIVHTHAAKGGTLGRLAALLAFPQPRDRPVVIHTFHGHSLTGYFSPPTTEVYRRIEQQLARFTDRLIAVSDEVRDELVAMRVAPAAKFEVVPLGFDLSPFRIIDPTREQLRLALRTELGIPSHARVVTLIARLVPIKRVDRFLRMAKSLGDLRDVWFLIVGDGELQDPLRRSTEARALEGRVVWAGFRRDMPSVYFASDVVVQTSDNEGTPVSLIEAQAAGVPVVSTRVGGTASIVGDARLLVSVEDEHGLAAAVRSLLEDLHLASGSAATGRARALVRFDIERLVSDIDAAYQASLGNGRRPLPRAAGLTQSDS
jgi:glycosyltransferase involved in cell wall biosynthesis